MGTHPIFESDFDCLTDLEKNLKSKMPGPASATNVGKSPKGGRAAGAGGPTVRKRNTGQSSGGKAKTTTNPSGNQMGPGNMWKFYTEDSPGIKVGPVPVLVMSLMFIASVFILHIWGKYTRS